MSTEDPVDEAVEVLQLLGLKEYEAKCSVGLSRLATGTAKRLSEVTDVPRTSVYDAIRLLEAQGLVELQHSSPQQFRAVPLEEAAETLRDQYEDRIERFANALSEADPVKPPDEGRIQEVWSMQGSAAIANRLEQLIANADDEVVLALGDEPLLTDELVAHLTALDPAVNLLVGAATESLEAEIRDAVPNATTFTAGLDWLRHDPGPNESVAIGRLLLVDRSNILVSTIVPETGDEQAIFGQGFRNSLIVVSRRLLAQGVMGQADANPE